MTSIHSQKSYRIAYEKRAQAAHTFERWDYLTSMSKRELAELICHLAALATDSYDDTLGDDVLLIARIEDEREALNLGGMI